MGKAVRERPPPAAGVGSVEPPKRPVPIIITVIIWLIGIAQRDAAIPRLIEITRRAGRGGGLRRGWRRAAEHHRQVVLAGGRNGGNGSLAVSADHERGRARNGGGSGRSGDPRSNRPRGNADADYQHLQRSTKQPDAHLARL